MGEENVSTVTPCCGSMLITRTSFRGQLPIEAKRTKRSFGLFANHPVEPTRYARRYGVGHLGDGPLPVGGEEVGALFAE